MAACHPARFKAELLCEDLLFGSEDALSPLLAVRDASSLLASSITCRGGVFFVSLNIKKSDPLMLEHQQRFLSLHASQSLTSTHWYIFSSNFRKAWITKAQCCTDLCACSDACSG